MINNIDTWKMLNELHALDVAINIDPKWSDEEFHNYVVHLYDVWVLNDWQLHAAIPELVYRMRGYRKQQWTTPFKPGARR